MPEVWGYCLSNIKVWTVSIALVLPIDDFTRAVGVIRCSLPLGGFPNHILVLHVLGCDFPGAFAPASWGLRLRWPEFPRSSFLKMAWDLTFPRLEEQLLTTMAFQGAAEQPQNDISQHPHMHQISSYNSGLFKCFPTQLRAWKNLEFSLEYVLKSSTLELRVL